MTEDRRHPGYARRSQMVLDPDPEVWLLASGPAPDVKE